MNDTNALGLNYTNYFSLCSNLATKRDVLSRVEVDDWNNQFSDSGFGSAQPPGFGRLSMETPKLTDFLSDPSGACLWIAKDLFC